MLFLRSPMRAPSNARVLFAPKPAGDAVRDRAVTVRPLVFVVALLVVAIVGAQGCSSTCDSDCNRQYNDCLKRAPPGAAHGDCTSAYDQCVAQCGHS
jgi:hypothetical protein